MNIKTNDIYSNNNGKKKVNIVIDFLYLCDTKWAGKKIKSCTKGKAKFYVNDIYSYKLAVEWFNLRRNPLARFCLLKPPSLECCHYYHWLELYCNNATQKHFYFKSLWPLLLFYKFLGSKCYWYLLDTWLKSITSIELVIPFYLRLEP